MPACCPHTLQLLLLEALTARSPLLTLNWEIAVTSMPSLNRSKTAVPQEQKACKIVSGKTGSSHRGKQW